MELLCSNSCIF